MIQLYNTFTRQLENFTPIKKNRVGLYTCGPTVYNFAHIGNLRTYIFEDILKRTLSYNGYKVKHVMNITDVGHLTSDADVGEDKMEKGAAREGKTAWEIAEFYTQTFREDLEELNIIPADKWPRATDHIREQIKLVKRLEKKGFTYRTADGVYFDTSKLADYGKLAGFIKEDLRAGARVDIGDKKNVTDFALWKFSPPLQKRQMEWKSPWGVGFPGWHIECSAMAVKYLGRPFDIHCGGIDLVPVHHTNEIAQSEAAYGKPLSNLWMHGEFLVIPGGNKMAKSGDNFITLQTLKDKGISPLAYRFFCLQTHYRKPLTFSWEALEGAQAGLNNLYKEAANYFGHAFEYDKKGYEKWIKEGQEDRDYALFKDQFCKSVNNDLNTPEALKFLWGHLRTSQPQASITAAKLEEADKILGLKIMESAKKITEHRSLTQYPAKVGEIISLRNLARAVKDWTKSDELRKKLEQMGYEVKDTKSGTEIGQR